MFQSLNSVTGASILAEDGTSGTASGFLFDDLTWAVRYLVVEAGNWLAWREVLVATTAVAEPDWEKLLIPVHLTKSQVRHSPAIDTHKPVSRQREIAMERYFDFPTYWSVRVPAGLHATEMQYPSDKTDDPHLRSAWDIAGYEVWATDGEIGRLDDYVVDHGWHLGYLIVNTGSWLDSRSLLVSTRWVKSISWANRRIDLSNVSVKVWSA